MDRGELSVLVACETSGTMREAFLREGFDAWSCDLLPSDTPSNRHIVDDVRNVLRFQKWHLLMVAHPPCTRLCNSGVRWLTGEKMPGDLGTTYDDETRAAFRAMTTEEKRAFLWEDLDRAAALFSDLWNADVPHIAIENPVMHRYAKERIRNYKPVSCSVQPWQFGNSIHSRDNERKRTCFWLKNLPKLKPTGFLNGSTARSSVHKASGRADRWKMRSESFPGMAKAAAKQWGGWALVSQI